MTLDRPHVLWAMNTMDVGGTEMFSIEIMPYLLKRFRVTVLLVHGRGTLFDRLKDTGAEVLCVHLPGKFREKRVLKARNLLKKLDPSILHTHSQSTGYLIRKAAILSGVPVMLTHFHGMIEIPSPDSRMIQQESRLLPCTQRVLFESRALREAYIRAISPERKLPRNVRSRLAISPGGVDVAALADPRPERWRELRRRYAIPEGAPIIGTVGRVHPHKNLEALLDATCLLKNRYPDIRCMIVGAGEAHYLKELALRCRELNIQPHVTFAGFQDDVSDYHGFFNVTVLASESEGVPRAVMESMSAGTPVVAGRVAGLESLIEDGVSGFLVNPVDAEALADRILALLSDLPLRERVSDAARSRAKGFDIRQTAARLMDTYESCLSQPLANVRARKLLYRAGYWFPGKR